MASETESDFELAMRIHRELNEIGDSMPNPYQWNFSAAPSFGDSVVVLSDSEDDEFKPIANHDKKPPPPAGSRSSGQVSLENQQAITVDTGNSLLRNVSLNGETFLFSRRLNEKRLHKTITICQRFKLTSISTSTKSGS
jgi:hypothetical protein